MYCLQNALRPLVQSLIFPGHAWVVESRIVLHGEVKKWNWLLQQQPMYYNWVARGNNVTQSLSARVIKSLIFIS
ncbi:MAG: hypothetical protein ABIQ88_01715 [Chitinophagaceae bacterium]